MTTRGRLAKLRAAVQIHLPPPLARRDEVGWLAAFEEWGREGVFDREPDFPVALANYRHALIRARASTDPPFDPPDDFRPDLHRPAERAACWRGIQFPDLPAGHEWLGEMLGRVTWQIPPVTEAEFAELATWFRANEERLYQLSLPSELLVVGDGRRTWCWRVRYELARGPRADGAGQAAEDVRQLRARYGEAGVTPVRHGL